MGVFSTENLGDITLSFPEYSRNKEIHLEPDILEYDDRNEPKFDLIIGAKTLTELGVVLDFKTQ